MTFLLIVLFVFIILVIIVMFMFLKRVVININKQSRDYFVDKLQTYDELISEKEEKLKGLNNRIKSRENNKEISKEIEKEDLLYTYDIKNIDYQDSNIFKKMKDIDSRFNINNIKIIERFIDKNVNDNDLLYYNQLVELKDKLDQSFIYKLVSKKSDIQEKEIKKIFIGDMAKIVDDFLKKNKSFNILKFVSYFDKIIKKEDPYIYVYVSSDKENYNDVNSFIRTRVDPNIYKGINIIYKGKLYDYSLK